MGMLPYREVYARCYGSCRSLQGYAPLLVVCLVTFQIGDTLVTFTLCGVRQAVRMH